MSLASMYRGQVKSAQSKVKSTRADRDRKRTTVATAKKRLSEAERKVAQARSDSQRQQLERQADGKRRELERADDGLGRSESALSKAEEAQAAAEVKLQKQEGDDQKAADRKAKQAEQKREQDERREEQRRARLDRERQQREVSRDAEIDRLQTVTTGLESRLLEAERLRAPVELTVLFLAASPEDESPLRLDKETRSIQKRMRSTEYRDAIFFEWRLARQPSDLVQDLNEIRPDVLHFSGHGNEKELAFEDADGKEVPLSNDQLGQLLQAAPVPIRLALFNSCNSASQAKLATSYVEVAIGMDATVEDNAAQVFAGQFYNSLGFGLSIQKAFEQANLQVEVECGSGHDVPRLFSADGVNAGVIALVNPA
jgi:hypothetical protein